MLHSLFEIHSLRKVLPNSQPLTRNTPPPSLLLYQPCINTRTLTPPARSYPAPLHPPHFYFSPPLLPTTN